MVYWKMRSFLIAITKLNWYFRIKGNASSMIKDVEYIDILKVK
jgi:hypothetical protein